jgi:membrane-associated phospholipid phosphatase
MPLIVKDKILLNHFVHVSLILLGISYITFIIWPISCAPVMLSVTQNPLSFLYGAVEISWLKQNGLPSVHVTISLFTALVLGTYRPRYRIIFLVCAFLVFLSTFLAKQHFIADALSGLLLAYFGFFYWKRTMRNN